MTDEARRSSGIILACGGLVLAISLGVRHGFGLFLQPVSMDNGWGREVFAFAIALPNLVWGAAQPFTGVPMLGPAATLPAATRVTHDGLT